MNCKECSKPCESPYNEDGECWLTNSLCQLITLGGKSVKRVIMRKLQSTMPMEQWGMRHEGNSNSDTQQGNSQR